LIGKLCDFEYGPGRNLPSSISQKYTTQYYGPVAVVIDWGVGIKIITALRRTEIYMCIGQTQLAALMNMH